MVIKRKDVIAAPYKETTFLEDSANSFHTAISRKASYQDRNISPKEQKSEPRPLETKKNKEMSQAFFKTPPALDNKNFKMGRTLSEDENFVDVLAKKLLGLNLSDKGKGPQVSVITEGEIDNLETIFKEEQPEISRLTNEKRFTQTAKTKNYYPRPTLVDLQFVEDGMWNSAQYDRSSIVEWNINGLTEYQIINTMKHMMMYATASKIKGNGDRRVAEAIIAGFFGQLKGYDSAMTKILNAQSVHDPATGVIKSEKVYQEDAVNSLIYTITLYFVGTIELQHERSREFLMNLKCPTLSHCRWYKDVFYSKGKKFGGHKTKKYKKYESKSEPKKPYRTFTKKKYAGETSKKTCKGKKSVIEEKYEQFEYENLMGEFQEKIEPLRREALQEEQGICFETPFVLVKGLNQFLIFGTPFINILYPCFVFEE
ncbi:hypothetical protein PRUPE_4G270900 [Prunus persica]|uniref:DUF7746 domain-containing protein n=1 Tax=Prunus persica TaxID=3760 RepID=A0A251PT39_PRUPE|nr:hypothetical protein PRUPE_4G270900 [Prunus persica]